MRLYCIFGVHATVPTFSRVQLRNRRKSLSGLNKLYSNRYYDIKKYKLIEFKLYIYSGRASILHLDFLMITIKIFDILQNWNGNTCITLPVLKYRNI